MPRPLPLLGAHLSTAGGLRKTLERAQGLQCRCVQIFTGNPRGWKGKPVALAEARAFHLAAPVFGVVEVVIHCIYLANLASPKPQVRRNSLLAVRRDLVSAQRLGVKNLVLHPGSDLGDGQGERRLLAALQSLQPAIPPGCRILLESMAGAPGSLGSLACLGRICRRLGAAFGICLDTAHLCAAGYDLKTSRDFSRWQRELQRLVGFGRVGCIHVNDSRHPCNSHRDHHENLGQGFVGERGLQRIIRHPRFAGLPMILETPGWDQLGPDLKNMRILKRLAGGRK